MRVCAPLPQSTRVPKLRGHLRATKPCSRPAAREEGLRLPEGPWLVVSSATNTAFSVPWGVSFTANLTPDPDTGLGNWTARDFKATIRTGRHMGRGRAILPAMHIPACKNFTDPDLEAIFAYLSTIPAVKNQVPEPRPSAAFPK
jgi:hypothetical protein